MESINHKYFPQRLIRRPETESTNTTDKKPPVKPTAPRRTSLRSQWSNTLSSTGSLVWQYWNTKRATPTDDRASNVTSDESPPEANDSGKDSPERTFGVDLDLLRSSNLFNYLVLFHKKSKWVPLLLFVLDRLEQHQAPECDRIGSLCALFLMAKDTQRSISNIRVDFFDTILNVVFSEQDQVALVRGSVSRG